MGRIINEDDWADQFKPKPAPTPGNGYDYGNGCTLIDGHSNEDREYLKGLNPRTVWTVVSSDADAILPGFHTVNRLGYIVTEKPWSDDIDEIELEDLSDDEED
ncbi:MAG: hypothetical protein CL472_00815 [Acidobacteria bacterium]|nr:hypothetical protein [Acidobacteriota bacterium]